MINHEKIVELADLKAGDHVSLLYKTNEYFEKTIIPFILLGLKNNEKVVYITDTHTSYFIINSIEKELKNIYEFINNGQFVILSYQDTYLKEGYFDPDKMIEFLKTSTNKAIEENYTALRTTGEMTWALRGFTGSDKLIEYVAKLNYFFKDENCRCIGLCQYDIKKFDYATLLDVISTHPYVIYEEDVFANFYYIQAPQFLSNNIHEAEFNNRLNNLKTYREQKSKLLKTKVTTEELLNIKTQFLSDITHEIRTPLNGISGMISLLSGTELDEKQMQYLNMLKSSCEFLKNTFEEILDFTRLESGHMMLKYEKFNLSELITEIININENLLQHKDIELTYIKNNKIPEYIIGDQVVIKKILQYLVNNSIKFTEKGVISIELDQEKISETEFMIKFIIKDSGIGISQKNLVNIINKFNIPGVVFSQDDDGIGLGLTIIKELLKKVNGKLGIESELNKGSKFIVSIPIQMNAPKQSNLTEEKPKKVLIVEDNLINAFYLQKFLEKYNFEIHSSDDGNKALEKIRTNKFDIILMDIKLPQMNGYECVKQIRKDEKSGEYTPIIAITGYAIEFDREKILAAGMDDFIAKPVNETILLNKINLMLEKYRTISP